MGSNSPLAGAPPPKPWERAGGSSGPGPFKPPSSGSTSDIVEASGTAKPGEVVPTIDRNVTTTNSTLTMPVPARPWQTNGANYGGYGSSIYNSSYGSNMYSSYGGLGSYGSLYGNNMYSSHGGLYGGSGMYGGGMYNSGFGPFGGPIGGYGMSMGGPYGNQDPNNPFGSPPSPPSFWMSLLRVMQGVVSFFGRVAILIDQNTQAFHLFMTALLQLFDRSGMLYGELARFVFRILGFRTKSNKHKQLGQGKLLDRAGQNFLKGPKTSASWDNVWADNKKGLS